MNTLHCATCKFTLSCTQEEVALYEQSMPRHCGLPMQWTGAGAATLKLSAEVLVATEKPEATVEEKPKKGLFGFGGKTKKKK